MTWPLLRTSELCIAEFGLSAIICFPATSPGIQFIRAQDCSVTTSASVWPIMYKDGSNMINSFEASNTLPENGHCNPARDGQRLAVLDSHPPNIIIPGQLHEEYVYAVASACG